MWYTGRSAPGAALGVCDYVYEQAGENMLVSPFRWRNICEGFEQTEMACPHCGAAMRRLRSAVVPEYGSVLRGRAVKEQAFLFCPRCGFSQEENKGE